MPVRRGERGRFKPDPHRVALTADGTIEVNGEVVGEWNKDRNGFYHGWTDQGIEVGPTQFRNSIIAQVRELYS